MSQVTLSITSFPPLKVSVQRYHIITFSADSIWDTV